MHSLFFTYREQMKRHLCANTHKETGFMKSFSERRKQHRQQRGSWGLNKVLMSTCQSYYKIVAIILIPTVRMHIPQEFIVQGAMLTPVLLLHQPHAFPSRVSAEAFPHNTRRCWSNPSTWSPDTIQRSPNATSFCLSSPCFRHRQHSHSQGIFSCVR